LIKASEDHQRSILCPTTFAVMATLHGQAFVARLQATLAEIGPLLKRSLVRMPPSYSGFIA
jgi:hypothetical protein